MSQSLTEVLVPTQLNVQSGTLHSPWQGRTLIEQFSISESMENLTVCGKSSGEIIN